MSIHPEGPNNSVKGGRAEDRPLMCSRCGSDRHLALNSITALTPPANGSVEVGYSCRRCRSHYLHQAAVVAVAAQLNRVRSPEDVLALGGHYIHCGQPMQKTGSELRRLNAPATTDQDLVDALDVYLTTQVLHCPCGFQMEVPD